MVFCCPAHFPIPGTCQVPIPPLVNLSHSSSSMRAQAHTSSTTHATHSALLQQHSQLWPCQRMCSRTPPDPVAAARNTTCGSVNTRSSRRGVLTAAATQPPTPTNDNKEQQQGGSSSSSSSQPGGQQPRANTNSDISSNSRKRTPTTSSSSTQSPFSIDDPQLLVGDCVALTAAALYRSEGGSFLPPLTSWAMQ